MSIDKQNLQNLFILLQNLKNLALDRLKRWGCRVGKATYF